MNADARITVPHETAPGRVSPTAGMPLSLRLREETADLHLEVERQLDLPAIRSLAAYRRCLERFHGLYEPLETLLASFTEWNRAGIVFPEYVHSARLASDLEALGDAPPLISGAPEEAMPRLPDFPHALGALYVMEGATLGAQFILRQVSEVLGDRIAGADTFFRGRGPATGAHWQRFRGLLDEYGYRSPEQASSVVGGARSTFQAIGVWMSETEGKP